MLKTLPGVKGQHKHRSLVHQNVRFSRNRFVNAPRPDISIMVYSTVRKTEVSFIKMLDFLEIFVSVPRPDITVLADWA